MAKIPCEIIRDLLPLYQDDICSEKSRNAIEEHIKECESCRTYLKKMEGDDNSVAGRGAGPADRGAAPGTGLPVRIFQMRHFRGSGAGILLPRE